MAKLFAILIFTLSFLILETQSTDTISLYSCSNLRNYTLNSTYERHLDLLLKRLPSLANSSYGFLNTSIGKPSSADAVYGRFLCRGDVTKSVCVECAKDASARIKTLCPNAKVSTLWYDECMLEYSDHHSLSALDQEPLLIGYNGENKDGPAKFMKQLNTTMKELITLVANQSDNKSRFHKPRNTDLYTFGQCRPDLSAAQCEGCLKNVTSTLLNNQTGKIGGRVLSPPCSARFEIYQYNKTVITESQSEKKRPSSSGLVIGISSAAASAVTLVCVAVWFTLRRKRNKIKSDEEEPIVGIEISELHPLQFDVGIIKAATNYFSNENKLGEGGFGPVYRGALPCGSWRIAAKRLSQSSNQGVQEFKNEVELVAKLQHRNLVRLLGFAMEREETILVYEYVPNGSLDQLLFDPQQSMRLDWTARHKIMVGVARGLLYLHEDSRLRIIHRDLKASNILLDDNMNPRISDFGMAKIFGAEQTQGTTNRIVGTYGYMSPEYAMYGQFSIKSDVFSFGVLMLEIITGKKNQYSYISDHDTGLLDYVWEHWRVGTPLKIMDPTISESFSTKEVIKCIHIGLLCVQNDKEARPAMDTVVLMLNSVDSVTLPLPKQPTFYDPYMKHKQQSQDQNSNRSSKELDSSKMVAQCSIISGGLTDVAPRSSFYRRATRTIKIQTHGRTK